MKRLAVLAFAFITAHSFAADALRVCADPDNLPFSRADGSGFENRIAQLAAEDMQRPLEYAWLPDRRGFVRKTMGAQLCDLIIGVPVAFGRTLNTQRYYRSTYVMVERRDAPAVRSFDDPRLAAMRIGVQLIGNDLAASPPGTVLAQHGYTDNVHGYPIVGDQPSAQRAIDAISRGEIDVAFLWGPQAGYFAKRSPVPLRVVALRAPAGTRFDFAIAMGVRRGDTRLRARMDDFIRRRGADIAHILAQYDVPVVPEGQP